MSLEKTEQILDKWLNELDEFDPADQASYKRATVTQQHYDRVSKAIDQKIRFEILRRNIGTVQVQAHGRSLPEGK